MARHDGPHYHDDDAPARLRCEIRRGREPRDARGGRRAPAHAHIRGVRRRLLILLCVNFVNLYLQKIYHIYKQNQ